MSNNKAQVQEQKVSRFVGVAVIMILAAIIVALSVLLILDSLGAFYPDNEVVITAPELENGTMLTEGAYKYARLKDGTVMIVLCTLEDGTTEVTVPSTLGGCKVSAIGESALALTASETLKTIILPEGITYIGMAAFFGVENANIYIPSTVTDIDKDAFSGVDDPEGIFYNGTEQDWLKIRVGSGNSVLAMVKYQ